MFACWAHSRRKFVEAQGKANVRAKRILKLIQELYRIEKHARIRGMAANERQELRKLKATRLLAAIEDNLTN